MQIIVDVTGQDCISMDPRLLSLTVYYAICIGCYFTNVHTYLVKIECNSQVVIIKQYDIFVIYLQVK